MPEAGDLRMQVPRTAASTSLFLFLGGIWLGPALRPCSCGSWVSRGPVVDITSGSAPWKRAARVLLSSAPPHTRTPHPPCDVLHATSAL